jgi:fatty-acyl-CoA synthase
MRSSPLAYAHGAHPVPLLGETIGANLERTAARVPCRDALVSVAQGVRLTYAELDAEVDRVARGLLARGVERGDRVGVWAANRAEWVLVQYATAKVGAILVTINPAYRSHELAYALGRSAVRLLVCDRGLREEDHAAMVDEVRGDLPALRDVVVLDGPDWAALLAAGDAVDAAALRERAATLAFDDPINIQYTSGTTGFPKGATLSHHNILNNGFFVAELLGYTEADRVCIPVPFYHCFGMVMGNLGCTTHGACIVVPAPAFDPAATLRAVEQERCTSLYGVPTMFIAELGDPAFAGRPARTLRTGIMAGSPCPVEVMRRVVARCTWARWPSATA